MSPFCVYARNVTKECLKHMYFIKKGGCMHNHLYYKRKQEEIKGLGESYFLLFLFSRSR